jgi:hypothetical protein
MRILRLAAAIAALGPLGAAAQNTGASPYYGAVSLQAGFAGDPYSVAITAGGSVEASRLGAGCMGSIGDSPDFELTYTPGSLSLYLSVMSDRDVSLIVNTPDGRWICDDDSAGNLNPGLTFSSPQQGIYDIWVGDLGGDRPATTLYISELGYQTGASESSSSGINLSGTPYYGEVTLSSGFSGDPYSIAVSAGGANDAATLGSPCVGMIGGPPDFNLHYTAAGLPLYISASADEDLTLVVNTPDGRWTCDDDGSDVALDPGLTWSKPASGTYNIWVGRYNSTSMPGATLHISELGYYSTRVDSASAAGIDFGAPAIYGEVRLTAGFTPDPYTTSLTPGGTYSASTVSGSCSGQIGGAPDLNLNYTAGTFPLYIFAESGDDTTLVVNTPNGTWLCDDDSGLGLNPGISLKSPASGAYNIWVGRFGDAQGQATLNISEATFPMD